jgi:phosphonate transport system ATP-binding protein
LRGVDLAVAKGEIVGLVGASGAGKSTLIRCVNRLIEPESGAIFFDGVEITRLKRRELRHARRRIGTVLRGCMVGRLSVIRNVLLGRSGFFGLSAGWLGRFSAGDSERAEALLERLGMTRCGERRLEGLSPRDRQIVGIARGLIQEPDILLVDDPTEGLNARAVHQVMRLLIDICAEQRLPAVVCLHDAQIAATFFSRIAALRDGVVTYDGPARDLTGEALRRAYGEEYWSGAMRSAIREPQGDRQGQMRDPELRAKAG